MRGLVTFCLVVGICALSYCLWCSWERIEELQELYNIEGECEYHFPAP